MNPVDKLNQILAFLINTEEGKTQGTTASATATEGTPKGEKSQEKGPEQQTTDTSGDAYKIFCEGTTPGGVVPIKRKADEVFREQNEKEKAQKIEKSHPITLSEVSLHTLTNVTQEEKALDACSQEFVNHIATETRNRAAQPVVLVTACGMLDEPTSQALVVKQMQTVTQKFPEDVAVIWHNTRDTCVARIQTLYKDLMLARRPKYNEVLPHAVDCCLLDDDKIQKHVDILKKIAPTVFPKHVSDIVRKNILQEAEKCCSSLKVASQEKLASIQKQIKEGSALDLPTELASLLAKVASSSVLSDQDKASLRDDIYACTALISVAAPSAPIARNFYTHEVPGPISTSQGKLQQVAIYMDKVIQSFVARDRRVVCDTFQGALLVEENTDGLELQVARAMSELREKDLAVLDILSSMCVNVFNAQAPGLFTQFDQDGSTLKLAVKAVLLAKEDIKAHTDALEKIYPEYVQQAH